MSDEKWLRDGLADAVPPPPTNPDRARAAESLARRRRRTTALAVVGTAGAVAAAAVLTATLASGGDDPNRPDRDVADDPAVVECPPAPAEGAIDPIDQPDPGAPDAVPEGATSARLCQGPGTPWDVPDDALVTDVDSLVDTVNTLDKTGEPEVCTMDLGPGYRIAFGYDDGSRFVVSGQLYGCRSVVVGSGYRSDSQPPWDRAIDLLRDQREALGPPDFRPDPATLDCSFGVDGPANSPVGDPATMGAAVLCVSDKNGVDVTAVPIGNEDLRILVIDLMENRGPMQYLRCLAVPALSIRGITWWGDQVEIHKVCRMFDLGDGTGWEPGPDATAILDRLVSEAR